MVKTACRIPPALVRFVVLIQTVPVLTQAVRPAILTVPVVNLVLPAIQGSLRARVLLADLAARAHRFVILAAVHQGSAVMFPLVPADAQVDSSAEANAANLDSLALIARVSVHLEISVMAANVAQLEQRVLVRDVVQMLR